jgi:hypothetical protein
MPNAPKQYKFCSGLRQWVIRRFGEGPIPEVRVVITRCERIDVDLRFSLLEIKRADQVDVLPSIGETSLTMSAAAWSPDASCNGRFAQIETAVHDARRFNARQSLMNCGFVVLSAKVP